MDEHLLARLAFASRWLRIIAVVTALMAVVVIWWSADGFWPGVTEDPLAFFATVWITCLSAVVVPLLAWLGSLGADALVLRWSAAPAVQAEAPADIGVEDQS